MPIKKSLVFRKEQAKKVQEGLQKRYPQPETHLYHETPWQLLVATVLSAQCTDARVNMVTPALFAKWKDPFALAKANIKDVEEVIKSTGFYHNKAKNIVAGAKFLVENYNGEVPRTMEELVKVAGVARKTANVVLYTAYGINEGIAVDTHVKRISYRLGLTDSQDPVQVEKDLMELFPQKEWGNVNHRLVWFGRHVCEARNPQCDECEFAVICPKREPKK